MQNYQYELKRITEIFLKPEDDYGEIKKAADDLYDLFLNMSSLRTEDDVCREDCFLPNGKAIGTVWAAMCIKELLRTKRFIRGVFLGIKHAQEIFPDTTIHILYAGTGPFATLIIPLTTVFTNKEVRFTLLEINSVSIKILEKIIMSLRAEEFIEDLVQCDATEYKVNKDKPVHMVITETMQNALKSEPQVAITLNLVPQMVKEGILIPQDIIIEAALIDPKRDMERMMGANGADMDYCFKLDKIFELNKDTKALEMEAGNYFCGVEVLIPRDIETRFKRLSLLTQIQVFGEEKLTYMQCSLNMPYKVMDIDWKNNYFNKVSFQYEVNENPGFLHKVIV